MLSICLCFVGCEETKVPQPIDPAIAEENAKFVEGLAYIVENSNKKDDSQSTDVSAEISPEQTQVDTSDSTDIDKDTRRDQELAEKLDKKIAELGEITLDSRSSLVFIRMEYNKLTETQKELVTKYDDFVAAEQTFQALLDSQSKQNP